MQSITPNTFSAIKNFFANRSREKPKGVYSNTVPLEKSIIDFAIAERGTKSVGTVLVLYTGGAIGMHKEGGVYKPKQHFLTNYLMKMPIFNDARFWEKAPPYYSCASPNNQLFETSTPSTVSVPLAMSLNENDRRVIYRLLEYENLLDSSNCDLDVWINLAKDLERFYNYFDGFVILHGTDTLPYAASALSFILENLSKPVVLTGSELPIDRLRNDGRHNLLGALLFAGGGYDIPEVTVYVQNQLYRGNRIVKVTTTGLTVFDAPNSKPLAETKEKVTVYEDRIWRGGKDASKPLRVQTNLCLDVAILRLSPSISIDIVKTFFRSPMKGVILQTFGAGNVPSNNKELIEVFKKAHDENGIILYNVTQCWRGTVATVYETGAILESVGAVSGYDITPEAALMKMAYVLGKWQSATLRKYMLSHNLRGELTELQMGTHRHHGMSGDSSEGSTECASVEMTRALGKALLDADEAGLASQWAEKLIYSLILASVESDNANMLEQILLITGHFEYRDSRGVTPLHVAARANAHGACQFLLKNGANANAVDVDGLTPLSYAVCGQNCTTALIIMMGEFGCHLPSLESDRAREANVAASEGRLRRLKLYRVAGLTLTELDTEGRSPLHTAVVYRQAKIVRYLVTPAKSGENESEDSEMGGAGVDPNQPTGYGTTALEEARRRNFGEIVEILESAIKRNSTNA